MKNFIGWVVLAVVIMLFIGQIGWYSVGVSTTDKPIDVPAGNWVAQILKVDETYENSVEAKLSVRHLGGPPVDIYVLDKGNFNLFESEGKGIMGFGGKKPEYYGWMVLNENFHAVNNNFELKKFNGQMETEWIPIGSQKTLYLVLSSRDGNRPAKVEAVLTVRDD